MIVAELSGWAIEQLEGEGGWYILIHRHGDCNDQATWNGKKWFCIGCAKVAPREISIAYDLLTMGGDAWPHGTSKL